jgi:phosphatidylglycerophosphate synthase
MRKPAFYLVNALTVYRLIASPVLIFFVFNDNVTLFKWLLPFSFFTDAVDGLLARKFKVTSVFGSKLDSIADDLTILAAIIAAFVLKLDFILSNLLLVAILLLLFLFQNTYALIKYHKLSSFHTYLAKAAAVLQGLFLIFLFLLPQPLYWLFYTAAIVTILDLVEEILLVKILPTWEINVKGLYWVYNRKKKTNRHINIL